ncbi:sulfatase [Sphingomonas sp.]|uniref:sulfatase family protein n=1 Tax=Sphingomonas sp. TaxID=28214 RepID=UPI001EB59ED6|nr:sulfatase [Sphingomonas sp.]MBX3592864.1 sulfatase [Sphingomonas sp.]
MHGGALGAATALANPVSAKDKVPAPGERPNILWFTSEDNFPVIGAYGDKLAYTPTIDRLARQGILFERAYCVSPVCGPSRFSILLGMHPASCGSSEDFGSLDEVLPRYIRGYPEYFRDLGYYRSNNQKKNYNSQFDYVMDLWDESSEEAHWNKRAAGQPFFAVFNTFTTHESSLFNGRKDLFGQPVREGRFKPEMMGGKIPPFLPDTEKVRTDFATFYNAMEHMDRELAFRLKELEDAGVADDTIIFYYGDNGGITPRGKRFCYDLGLRNPLIIYVPPKWRHLSQYAPGSRVKEPVTFNDLMPTVLSLVDIEAPKHVQGRALIGPRQGKPMKYAVGGRDRMDERYDLSRSITDGRFRYIRNYTPHRPWGQHVEFMFQAGSYQDWHALHLAGKLTPQQERFWQPKPYEELYDVEADFHMVDNLAARADHAGKLAELSRALDAHMIDIVDNGLIPEGCAAEGYVNSRNPLAYPIRDVMKLAALAASRPADMKPFLDAFDHDNEVMRYWAAMGFLIAGERALPHAGRLKRQLLDEPSPATRIVLSEALVNLTNDDFALNMLGFIIDTEDDGPFRMQAINALDFVGERARPVLPAIRRSAKEDHRSVRKVAKYIIQKLEGTYDPYKVDRSPGGFVDTDPRKNQPEGAPRPYD